jgi:hypothetical protein
MAPFLINKAKYSPDLGLGISLVQLFEVLGTVTQWSLKCLGSLVNHTARKIQRE